MKKIRQFLTAIITVAMMTVSLTACGAQPDDAAPNTASPDDSSAADVVSTIKERGMEITIPQELADKGLEVDGYGENIKGSRTLSVSYYSPSFYSLMDEVLDMDPVDRTPESDMEYLMKMWDVSRTVMEIAMVETQEYERRTAAGEKPEDFTYYAPAEVLGTNDGYTYIAAIPELDNGSLNETERKDYQQCRDYMQTLKNELVFIPVELERSGNGMGGSMPEFSTEDLSGNVVTNEIFSQARLTVVNVWGTFCGPCIEEMPDLAEWDKELPEDVQIIGLVGDIAGKEDTEHIELAQMIVESAGVEFVNLIVNGDFSALMGGIIGFPTTFFVDSEGNIVGEPVIGANVAGYKAFVEGYTGE